MAATAHVCRAQVLSRLTYVMSGLDRTDLARADLSRREAVGFAGRVPSREGAGFPF